MTVIANNTGAGNSDIWPNNEQGHTFFPIDCTCGVKLGLQSIF